MKITATFTCLSVLLCCISTAQADTFGSGANQFDIDFVTIGNPGNVDDTTGNPSPVGKVDYTYRIGQFEISEEMINKANTLGGLGISHNNRGANRPATSISWFEAARFVNWLNTESGTSEAYKFNGNSFELWQPGDEGYNPDNLFRNSGAKYFLPSFDEWYKAAYYDPKAGVYYNFPTGSNIAPTAVSSGTAADTAVYSQRFALSPADVTLAGGLSPYGTMGQGGNVWEWEETEFDLMNDSSSSTRGLRGGGWVNDPGSLRPGDRFDIRPSSESSNFGFRVASIPEPRSLLLMALSVGGFVAWNRRFV